MQKFLLGMCALLVFCGFAATNAKADALTIGGGFSAYDECLNGGDINTTGCTASGAGHFFAETWTFSGPADLTVTDIYVPGDSFAVYDNAHLVLTTPTVPDWSVDADCEDTSGNPATADPFGPCFTSNPNLALTNPDFSSGSVNLGGGAHNITIEEITEPSGFDDSTVAIEITAPTATPETSSLLLLATGLIALGALAFFTRGRRVQTAACPS